MGSVDEFVAAALRRFAVQNARPGSGPRGARPSGSIWPCRWNPPVAPAVSERESASSKVAWRTLGNRLVVHLTVAENGGAIAIAFPSAFDVVLQTAHELVGSARDH